MKKRDLLIYILGYLNGLNTMSKVSKDKVLKIKEIIEEFDNQKRLEQENDEFENEDDYANQYYDETDESYDNDSHYNEDLDLDQQHPDFYC